jgi:beta-glucanase (GH16 family)
MTKSPSLLLVACLSVLGIVGSLSAADPKALIDFSQAGSLDRCAPTCSQVTVATSTNAAAPGLVVNLAAGDEGYPGLNIKPQGDAWDLSAFGHVEAKIVNTGEKAIGVNLRVDNAGDWKKNPWNTESTYLKPGETKTVNVIFGYQYGKKPGYKLDPSKVVNLLLFTGKVKADSSFRIESIMAAGDAGEKPPVNPNDVRIKPEDGFLLGGPVKLDVGKQIEAKDGASGELVEQGGAQLLRLQFPAKKSEHTVRVKPPIGRWNLAHATEVRVKLTNVGQTPVTPGLRVTSDRRNATATVFAEQPLAPGASVEIAGDFVATTVWKGPEETVTKAHVQGQKGTGTSFASNKTDAVEIVAKHEGEATLLIESIQAVTVPATVPAWLGKRPPVQGDWTMTFADDFNGDTIDRERWNIYTENYWDKRSHFSKDNVLVGDGVVRLRMERKRGHENDDPERKETDYTVGYLDTYGMWAQRYGYFEARMKLPTAPGLWPAFWMMPDRGPDSGPQWKRASTSDGAMEFDIMEHLTRWGPYRYNIAMHWDGYQKDHKSIGTSGAYVQPDKDGFITCGLLWTPGSAIYYCNGEVVAEWKNDRISSVQCYPILYMVTGGWDNDPVDDETLPADFVIDYIRIWQRQDLASELDGKIAPAKAAPQADAGPRAVSPNRPEADGKIPMLTEGLKASDIRLEGATGVQIVEHAGTKALLAEFPKDNYPAIALPVKDGGWNLLGAAGAQVDVTNQGQDTVKVALRVDNEGHWSKSPWNTEAITLKPGEAGTIKVTFGKSYGGNPGFKLDEGNVVAFKVYLDKPKGATKVLIGNLRTFGTK